MIKHLVLGVLFIYPALELSRLILVYPHWGYMDCRPVVELVLIWGCFLFGIYLCDKNIRCINTRKIK